MGCTALLKTKGPHPAKLAPPDPETCFSSQLQYQGRFLYDLVFLSQFIRVTKSALVGDM